MTALPRAPVLALGALALLAILALSTAAMAQTARPGSSAPGMEENRREARLLADTLEIPRHAEDLMVRMRAEMIQACEDNRGVDCAVEVDTELGAERLEGEGGTRHLAPPGKR